ncbi:Desi-like protein [Thalictrum thalictroides]|uniref:Desi-like protein n=1 Tax=Thalictrum thalictroides TaxID=46969 RepID=A0A7J6V962_THATH|nr:Desi-like protein [Thalictrum thalictroides]
MFVHVSPGNIYLDGLDLEAACVYFSRRYHGDTYHLIAKNCNHFTDDVCTRLTGKHIPGWVNRLAKLGSFCNCLLPESIQVTTAIRHLPDHTVYSDGSESLVSSDEESGDDGSNHHLLTIPNNDILFLKDRPTSEARKRAHVVIGILLG